MHKVIGEGSYGCVHKPSLKCKQKMNYKNKLSKIIQTHLGEEELAEYKKIANVDKDKKFYLGVPEICTPQTSLENLRAIDKCRDFSISNIDEYSLLIMPDGGINLNEFAQKVKIMEFTPTSQSYIMNFWLNGHRLLKGIKEMLKHSIVHHDLKPGNIVFNEKEQRLNFIDFGFMDYKKEIIKKLQKSNHKLSRPYWYFPFELVLMDHRTFLKICKSKPQKKKILFERLLRNKDYETELHMQIFYDKVDNSKFFIDENNEIFYNLFMNLDENKYNEYLDKMLNTIDIYGIGISFLEVLNNCGHLMEPNIHSDLTELCKTMVSASLEIRPNIEEVLQRYELIIEKSGILGKKNLYFLNHDIHKKDKLLRILYKSLKKQSKSRKRDLKKLSNKPIKFKNITSKIY